MGIVVLLCVSIIVVRSVSIASEPDCYSCLQYNVTSESGIYVIQGGTCWKGNVDCSEKVKICLPDGQQKCQEDICMDWLSGCTSGPPPER